MQQWLLANKLANQLPKQPTVRLLVMVHVYNSNPYGTARWRPLPVSEAISRRTAHKRTKTAHCNQACSPMSDSADCEPCQQQTRHPPPASSLRHTVHAGNRLQKPMFSVPLGGTQQCRAWCTGNERTDDNEHAHNNPALLAACRAWRTLTAPARTS